MNNIESFSENSIENNVEELLTLIDEVPINKLLGHTFYKLLQSKKLTRTEASIKEFNSINLREKKDFLIKEYNTRFANVIDINKITLGNTLPNISISSVNSFMNIVHIGVFKSHFEKIPIKMKLGNEKSSKLPIHDIILKKITETKKGKFIHLTKPSDIKINKSDLTEIVILENFPSKSKINIQSPNPLTIISINSQVEINYVVNNLNNILYTGKCGKRIKSESPISLTPKSETPKSETPRSETPSSETPKSETPRSETPSSETPKSETPSSETPKSETPSSESSDLVISGISQEQKLMIKSEAESKQLKLAQIKSEIKSECPVCPTLSCPEKVNCPGCPSCPVCPKCQECKYDLLSKLKFEKPTIPDSLKNLPDNIKNLPDNIKIPDSLKNLSDNIKIPDSLKLQETPKLSNKWIVAILMLFIAAGVFGYIYWSTKNKESNKNQNKNFGLF